jgi:hypothetical protein
LKSWYRSKFGKFEKFASILSARFQLENWNAPSRLSSEPSQLGLARAGKFQLGLITSGYMTETLRTDFCVLAYNNGSHKWMHILGLKLVWLTKYFVNTNQFLFGLKDRVLCLLESNYISLSYEQVFGIL